MKHNEDSLRQIFADLRTGLTPGVAVAVMQDNEVVYCGGFGTANLEYSAPVTPDTVFHIASISKQFTCFAICLLARAGKLHYDDPIIRHLPYMEKVGSEITIRHMMHHVSGLRDQWELLRLAGWQMDDVITQQQIVRLLSRQQELNFVPGSEYMYSNSGYTLLAEIVKAASSLSLRDFASKHIFEPLGMKNTHFHDDHREIVPGRAYSYSPAGSGFRHSVLNYANVGATSLFTTVLDLSRWAANLTNRQVGGDAISDLFSEFTLSNGTTIPYMFGINRGQYRGLKHFGHTGSDAGYRTAFLNFPEQRFSVIVFANFSSSLPTMYAQRIADIYLAEQFTEAGQENAPTEICSEATTEGYTGEYLISLAGIKVTAEREWDQLFVRIGEEDRHMLLPTGKDRFFHEHLQAEITAQRDKDGAVVSLTLPVYGQQLIANRIRAHSLSLKEQEEMSGLYRCPELGATYELKAENGAFALKHLRLPDYQLIPTGEDVLEGTNRIGRVTFCRGDEGITGFRMTGTRVRNLWFARVPGEMC